MPICTAFRVNGASLVCDQFVETSFFKGATSVCAHYAGFRRVASVELDADRYRAGLELPLVAEGKIRLYHGSSPDVLPEMIDPSLKTMVYLDGHFMGAECGPADPKYGECPLMEELHVLFDLPWDMYPTIVIDDANMLHRPWGDDLSSRFDERQWPTVQQVVSVFPAGYKFVESGCVLYALPGR